MRPGSVMLPNQNPIEIKGIVVVQAQHPLRISV
jgi:hypothetical protein